VEAGLHAGTEKTCPMSGLRESGVGRGESLGTRLSESSEMVNASGKSPITPYGVWLKLGYVQGEVSWVADCCISEGPVSPTVTSWLGYEMLLEKPVNWPG